MPTTIPGLKSPDYYKSLMEQPVQEAEDYLMSPEFSEKSRKRRSQLAGGGALSGTAYDRMQETTAGDILRTGYREGQDLSTQARLGDIDWGSKQLPFLEAVMTGTYKGSPTLQGKLAESSLAKEEADYWKSLAEGATTVDWGNLWETLKNLGNFNF